MTAAPTFHVKPAPASPARSQVRRKRRWSQVAAACAAFRGAGSPAVAFRRTASGRHSAAASAAEAQELKERPT